MAALWLDDCDICSSQYSSPYKCSVFLNTKFDIVVQEINYFTCKLVIVINNLLILFKSHKVQDGRYVPLWPYLAF